MMLTDQYVSWPRILEWAKAHGAINDLIVELKIGIRHLNGEMRGAVTIVGRAVDDEGKPIVLALEHAPSLWSVTSDLRYLP